MIIIQDEFDPSLPLVFRWTLPTADTLTQFLLPTGVKKITLRFETNAGYFTFIGTDQASLPTHYGKCDADTWLEINLKLSGAENTAKTSIYLAPASNSTVVQVLLEA